MPQEPEGPLEVGLADAIGQVRKELETAQERARASGVAFKVEKVTLEFTVQVRREAGGRAGLRIGVVTAEAGGSASRDNTHRVQVELQPKRPDGSDFDVERGGDG